MTDNSNFVLRWEIDDAAARCATGKVESGVFTVEEFEWTATAERCDNKADFTLRCHLDRKQFWKCEGEIDVYLRNKGGKINVSGQTSFCFNEVSSLWRYSAQNVSWNVFTHPKYNNNDKVIMEFHIRIAVSETGLSVADLAKFASPNSRSDVVLKIGDEKLHVSKEYLAVHSPVFEALFFGEFADKEEVEIKDVAYEEFVDLLHVIYPGRVKITDSTLPHVLALGDRFQMERVLALAETHLQLSKKFNTAQKLQLADQYRLIELRDYCLKTYTTVREIGALESTPEYFNFSESTKAAICDRMMELVKSMKMTDNSNIVIHWEINNATATLATGKAESAVFDKGGFRWTAAVQRHDASHNAKIDFTLKCDAYRRQSWECDATVGLNLLRSDGNYNMCTTERVNLDGNLSSWTYITKDMLWNRLTSAYLNANDKVIIKFPIHIISSKRGEPIPDDSKFAVSNNMSNVILLIGDKKLHVFKEYLALHSHVFGAMFFGDFAERGKEEVVIKDVVYEEFVDLLHVIYPGRAKIIDSTIHHVLRLGDRFQMERVLELAETHLQTSKKFNTVEKLHLADQYRLAELRDCCLKTYSTVRDIASLESTPEFAKFSDTMKAAICNRMMKLANQ